MVEIQNKTMRNLKRSERSGHWVRGYRKSIASFYFLFFSPLRSIQFYSDLHETESKRSKSSIHLETLFVRAKMEEGGQKFKKKRDYSLDENPQRAAPSSILFKSEKAVHYKLAQTQEPKKKKVPCDPLNVTGPEFEYPKTRRTKSKEEIKMTKKEKEEEKKVKPFDRRRFLHQKP